MRLWLHITVLFVSIALALLFELLARQSKRRHVGGASLYCFPLWYKIGACIAFLPGLFILSIEDSLETPMGFLTIGAIEVAVGYAMLSIATTTVRITERSVVKADLFRTQTLSFNEVNSITKSDWDQSYKLRASDGTCLRLSFYIAGIDDVVSRVIHSSAH